MMTSLSSRFQKIGRKKIVFLTGAGISAESQIPTFRGEEGYWTVGSTHYHPTELATNQAFREMPDEVWCWYLYRRTVCNRAVPNAGHEILVEMEDLLGDRFLLVTQNVDGLHLRAGNSLAKTYQVHGNINFMRCWRECSNELFLIPEEIGEMERGESLSDKQKALLQCPKCEALARPHVLWFDECYDEEKFHYHSSQRAASECVALVSVGSSGSTNLPTQMLQRAAGRGALVIDINPEKGPYSRIAEMSNGVWLQSSASQGLQEVAQAIKATVN